MESWNPYYVAYASAHGKTPQEMIIHDGITYPGGNMTGFMLWINEMKSLFYIKSPESFLDRDTILDIGAWEVFLSNSSEGMN